MSANGEVRRDDISLHASDRDPRHFKLDTFSGTTDASEDASLVQKHHRVDLKTAVRLRLAVIVVSWISIISLACLGIATFVLAIYDESSASFAFALDAILDCMSSVVVIWRYSGSPSTLYSIKRERIACTVLGCLFFISAIVIAVRSSLSLADHVLPEVDPVLFFFALANGITCLSLVIAKLFLAYKLESRSILTDAVNSAIGTILAFSILVSEIVYHKNSSIWQVDPVTGVICSVLLLLYGVWIIYESVKDMEICRNSADKQEDKTKLDP